MGKPPDLTGGDLVRSCGGWDLDRLAQKSAKINELVVTMNHLAGLINISQPAVSVCARRGEQLASAEGLSLMD